jgi:LysR family transcriptional regulator, transcriptional activator of the cysJI operon
MNIEHLKVFYTAAKTKNFSETARSLHLSQPTVSSQIRQLEEHLNTKLFNRTTKKIELTTSGKMLFQYADQILSLIYEAEKDINLLSNTVHGNLTIGASLTIGEYILPSILGKFKRKYPHINLIMKTFNSEQIISNLHHSEIEVGFIESTLFYPYFEQQAFLEDELVIITSTHPSHSIIGDRTHITHDELFQLPIILREQGSGTRQVIEENLQKHHLDPNKLNVMLELPNTEAIKSAVESGMGISIISKSAIKKELQIGSLRTVSIKDIQMKRYFYTVHEKQQLTPAAELFLAFTHEHFQYEELSLCIS